MTSDPSPATPPERPPTTSDEEMKNAYAVLLKNARDVGAGITQMVAYNAAHEPLWCIVTVTNTEQARDVLAALEGID